MTADDVDRATGAHRSGTRSNHGPVGVKVFVKSAMAKEVAMRDTFYWVHTIFCSRNFTRGGFGSISDFDIVAAAMSVIEG